MEPIAIYLFVSALFILVILKIKTTNSSSKLPPGLWKLPIIGNLHQLAAGGPLIHKVLRDIAKKHGPLVHLQLGHVSTILVSSPEIAKQVMKTHDIVFASRSQPLSAKIISYDSANIGFAPYGDYWRQMRKICVLDLLSTKRVQSFRSLREEEFSGLARLLASHAGSPVNLTQMLHATMLGFTSRAAFGKKYKNQEKFISILCELLKVGTGFNIADFYPSIKWLQDITGLRTKLEKLHLEVDSLLDEIIDDHIADDNNNTSMHEDLVDVLLRVQNDRNYEITRNNIKAVILDMFAAGTDTSATTIDWTMAEMLKNPSALEKAQEEVRRVFSEKDGVYMTTSGNIDGTVSSIGQHLADQALVTGQIHLLLRCENDMHCYPNVDGASESCYGCSCQLTLETDNLGYCYSVPAYTKFNCSTEGKGDSSLIHVQLEMHLQEMQTEFENLVWERKELEKNIQVAIKDKKILQVMLAELEGEHDEAIVKIEQLEAQLQDMKVENQRLNEVHGKALSDRRDHFDGQGYSVPFWRSSGIVSVAIDQEGTQEDSGDDKSKSETTNHHDFMGARSYRHIKQCTDMSSDVLHQRRDLAVSQTLFSAILSLLVGMIVWKAEDACMPLVLALFTVVGMSLWSVVQFFSTIKNRPASDAVALLSFNWFLLGTLTYPTLPRITPVFAPVLCTLSDRTVELLGF
ncbi:hypothetical protein K7X08_012775 [Anisodus acutangulus]|uniref:Cytochrome P450 n=1 Tax=Anisodus acutangulus TaxID=402998 RepID=A0A9Q1MD66_9SOLA|nr:hypothetical protein K7X08_012775 [Anisodus acutangulus]